MASTLTPTAKYTNTHREWSAISGTIDAVRDIKPPDGYPYVNFDRTFWACTNGVVPLACDHECSFELVHQCNLYDNHPGLDRVADEVRA